MTRVNTRIGWRQSLILQYRLAPEEAGHGYITTQLLLLIEKCPRIRATACNGEKC